ncbi:hypothetical protein CgunFtcFv8_005635 [Champsocephalus gunnari]|uniref:Uncharacterized protein n=1 Tax=Champsocephalus gunnari TaxID=52237 RepID=A0AAN8HCY5_CHAGU|nr:hypothetical protein CgunFtcFv8_005635 [Champsocephalus gunnari]
MAHKKKSREQKMMEETKFFRSNAIALIEKMLELNILREDGDKHLVDEILHSIFFLGRIITPQLLPDKIEESILMCARHDCFPGRTREGRYNNKEA